MGLKSRFNLSYNQLIIVHTLSQTVLTILIRSSKYKEGLIWSYDNFHHRMEGEMRPTNYWENRTTSIVIGTTSLLVGYELLNCGVQRSTQLRREHLLGSCKPDLTNFLPSDISTPTPIDCGTFFKTVYSRQPVPVPKSINFGFGIDFIRSMHVSATYCWAILSAFSCYNFWIRSRD